MKYTAHKLMAFFVLVLMCSLSHSLSATSYITYVDDVEYRGSLRYENAGYTLTYAESNEEKFKKIIEQARDLTAMKLQLRTDIRASIIQALGEDAELVDYQFWIDGPIVVDLVGNPDGTITARVGGFSLSAFAKAKIDWYPDPSVWIDTNTLWLVGDYNVTTGKIEELIAEDFIVDIDVDLEWFLDFLPGFDDLLGIAEGLLTYLVDQQINNALAEQENKVFFNLNEAIPSDTYVFGNFDAGQELKDLVSGLFTDLVSGESFRLEITDKRHRYIAMETYGIPNINPGTDPGYTFFAKHTLHNVSINFSDHLFIDFEDILHFDSYIDEDCPGNCSFPAPEDSPDTAPNPSDITIVNPEGETLVIPYGLDFDFNSLYLLFEANEPPPPAADSGELMASDGTYGSYINPDCAWLATSDGPDLYCYGSLVAIKRSYDLNASYETVTRVVLSDTEKYVIEGIYPNFKITAK